MRACLLRGIDLGKLIAKTAAITLACIIVLALVLFVFVMVVTIAQFAISKFWVHYDE